MYVLEHNNQVINGPRQWNYHSFESSLEDDLDIIQKLPARKEDNFIIEIDSNTHIYKAELISPEYDPKFEYLHGPFWDFTTGIAVGTYTKETYDTNTIKGKLKEIVTANRYTKEISGVKTTVQGLEVSIDTSRDGRNIFVQKYVLMQDTDVAEWKFPEGWLTLTKSELGQIVSVGASYIQSQFDWEKNKMIEIDGLQTVEELKLVDLG
jgi:hypothetical protein